MSRQINLKCAQGGTHLVANDIADQVNILVIFKVGRRPEFAKGEGIERTQERLSPEVL